MGLFGSIGKNLKNNFKSGQLMANLQSAGAIAHGDYGMAAQIQAQHRRSLQEGEEAQARQQGLQQTVAALIARGVPENEAAVIAQGGRADALLPRFQGALGNPGAPIPAPAGGPSPRPAYPGAPVGRLTPLDERGEGSGRRSSRPTATGPYGQKIVFNGKKWVRIK